MTSVTLPPIKITASDYCRLRILARRAIKESHPVGDFLFAELRRADIVDDSELPNDHVRMDAWVTFRTDWRWHTERRMLVHPDDYQRPETQLSVLSPVGAALIGLPVGAWMPYRTMDDRPHVTMAESVALQRGLRSLFSRPNRKPHKTKSSDDPDDPGPAAA